MTDTIENLNLKVSGTNGDDSDDKELSLEELSLLLCTDRVRMLEEKTRKEFTELKKRQSEVRFLHKLLKGINAATDSKGNLNLNDYPDLQELLEQAREFGVDTPQDKTKFSREEKECLIENIRLTTDDLNIQNEMQIQSITRFTNERYESFQMARSILKPLHEDKINKARAIAR